MGWGGGGGGEGGPCFHVPNKSFLVFRGSLKVFHDFGVYFSSRVPSCIFLLLQCSQKVIAMFPCLPETPREPQ